MVGFKNVGSANPNSAHVILALMEKHGKAQNLITQNVDRLHQKAGHESVLELHGTIHEVECMSCGHEFSRDYMQGLLIRDNLTWQQRFLHTSQARPDGDAELPPEAYSDFIIPSCERCGSQLLKPRVVFHGGSLPPATAAASTALAAACDGLLVVGSTLSTFSAFRLLREAARRHGRVGVLSYGATRADPLAAFKIEASAGGVLSALAARLRLPGYDVA
jgi:NAD-dependent deacetylase sirtuin 4